MDLEQIGQLAQDSERKVLLYVLDGLGGLPMEPGGLTELEAAATPNMDELAHAGSCGLHEPVAPGVTPGSGPGHLALFGYDPLRYETGRGVLSALGVEFPLQSSDIAARGNFCTLDAEGLVTDRRAGRIASEDAEPLVEALDAIELDGAEVFVRHVKEHRFLLVIRPEEPVGPDLADTDPGRTGVPPETVRALNAPSRPAVELVGAWLDAARDVLADQPHANMGLLRGFSSLPAWPTFPDTFGMRAFGAAAYPMYRGVARLVGMEARAVSEEPESLVHELQKRFDDYDFFFLHYKPPDKAGEDGDFDQKVAYIEAADRIVPGLIEAGPDVVLITGDHSTPALLRSHSWHPVPFLLYGGVGRSDSARRFGDRDCASGSMGLRRGRDLMPLAAARAGRLAKFGA
jgi:2,3-bisphosphoglycerate-independent phosphoglycerate mutase